MSDPTFTGDVARDGPTAATGQLADVLSLVRTTLGSTLLGAYLHGSSVAGGLRPDSDLDVLLVTRVPMTDAQRRALVTGLLPVSGRDRRGPGDRSIELAAVVRDDVTPWRYPPVLDFLYGDWERADYEAGRFPVRRESTDLVTLLTAARSTGLPLVGPPLAEVLDPVPATDLRRAIVEAVPALMGDLADDTRNVLLTLARVWLTLETGEIRPKDAAADWALERLPAADRPVMLHARAIYLGDTEERWDGPGLDGVASCAGALLAGIRTAAGRA